MLTLYNTTVLMYSCVLTEYNTLYKKNRHIYNYMCNYNSVFLYTTHAKKYADNIRKVDRDQFTA